MKIPEVSKVRVNKPSSQKGGSIEFWDLPNVGRATIETDSMFPFAKNGVKDPLKRDMGSPKTARQALFDCMARLLVFAFDGEVAPYRFRDADGANWRMESSAASWLLTSGNWELVERDGVKDFGFKPIN